MSKQLGSSLRPALLIWVFAACALLGPSAARAQQPNVEILSPSSSSIATVPAPGMSADEPQVTVVSRFHNGFSPLSAKVYIKEADGSHTFHDSTNTFEAFVYTDSQIAYRSYLNCRGDGTVVKIEVVGFLVDADDPDPMQDSASVTNVTINVD